MKKILAALILGGMEFCAVFAFVLFTDWRVIVVPLLAVFILAALLTWAVYQLTEYDLL